MHVQTVDPAAETATCPYCHTIQNVDVVWHDEEKDLMSGQRCWYCGEELNAEEVEATAEFNLVLSGSEVPANADQIGTWTQTLAHQFGSNPVGYSFDTAGRCIIAMHRVKTDADDLDVPVE